MNPTKRVSASEWIEALMPLWNEGFVECEAGHKHLRQSLICPICQIQEKIAHSLGVYPMENHQLMILSIHQ